jgi:hypothetical protein
LDGGYTEQRVHITTTTKQQQQQQQQQNHDFDDSHYPLLTLPHLFPSPPPPLPAILLAILPNTLKN